MDEATAARLRKRAVLSAARMGFTERSEDLAHDAIVEWLEGRGQHQTVDQAVIDAIRRAFGRPGLPGHELRRNLEQRPKSMDRLARHTSREVDRDSVHDFDRLIRTLEPIQRAIVCLRYVWGFQEIEIAQCFGVSESRISQRLQAALSRIASRERQRKEPATISREIQERPGMDGETQGLLEEVGSEARERLSPREIEKIQEVLLETFGDSTF